MTSALPTVGPSVVDGFHAVPMCLADDPDFVRGIARCVEADLLLWLRLARCDSDSTLLAPTLYALVHNRAARNALTITLGPAGAETLGAALLDAALDPDHCTVCGEYATRPDGLCDQHGHGEETRARRAM